MSEELLKNILTVVFLLVIIFPIIYILLPRLVRYIVRFQGRSAADLLRLEKDLGVVEVANLNDHRKFKLSNVGVERNSNSFVVRGSVVSSTGGVVGKYVVNQKIAGKGLGFSSVAVLLGEKMCLLQEDLLYTRFYIGDVQVASMYKGPFSWLPVFRNVVKLNRGSKYSVKTDVVSASRLAEARTSSIADSVKNIDDDKRFDSSDGALVDGGLRVVTQRGELVASVVRSESDDGSVEVVFEKIENEEAIPVLLLVCVQFSGSMGIFQRIVN